MRPKQSDNKGVQKYADRYRRLHRLAEEAPANINTLAQRWISGLRHDIKQAVRMQAPTTFNKALTLAKRKEDVEVLGELEDGIIETVGKTSAKQIKSISANLHAGEDMAKNTAGAALKEKTPVKTKAGAIDPDNFKEFQKEMGPEVTDVAMEELINRYSAWQLFTQVYEDRSKVKEEIIKKFRVTTKKVSGGGDAPSFCSFCKKSGHSYQGCEELKT